jgi:hypothetical protein
MDGNPIKPTLQQPKMFTIKEFCQAYRIPRSTLNKLWKDHIGPQRFGIGRRVLISHDDAERWLRQMRRMEGRP